MLSWRGRGRARRGVRFGGAGSSAGQWPYSVSEWSCDLEAEASPPRSGAARSSADELLDAAAVHAHDVVVMLALVQLEHRRAALEMMARDEPGLLELRQHPVDGREADVFALARSGAVDVLARTCAAVAAGQDLEDLHARRVTLSPALRRLLVSTESASAVRARARFRYDARPLSWPGELRPMRPDPVLRRHPDLRREPSPLVRRRGCVYRMNIQQGNLLERRARSTRSRSA